MDPIYENCFWLASAGPYAPNPALAGEVTADVAIIGGGFTGLSAAYHLRRADPGLTVVVLEGERIGFGASGRNGGFAMTVFGLSVWWTVKRFGDSRAKEIQQYMEQAVELVGELVQEHQIDCDYERTGFIRAATTPGYVKRIKNDIATINRLGLTGIEWLEQEEVRRRVNSPTYLGGWWEPRCALVQPTKLVRGMKGVAQRFGAVIYEETPVQEITPGDPFVLRTPQGLVRAKKLVFATNAYSHLFPALRRKQVPAFTYMVATVPLSPAQRAEIGWQGREGLEDARNLIHYYRLSADDRLIMGGGPVGLAFAADMNRDRNAAAWEHLQQFIGRVFPTLRGIKVEYQWGGPFSVPVDLAPVIGYIGDARAVYSLGCTGHGVAMTQMNGQVIRDLILERKTALTDLCFVNRRLIPWPPEPLRLMVSVALRSYLQLEDYLYEK